MSNRMLSEEKTKNQNMLSKAKQTNKKTRTHNSLYSVISSCKDLASLKHVYHFYNKN